MVSGQLRLANCMTSVCVHCVISRLTMRSTPVLHRQRMATVLKWTSASRLGCTMISRRRAKLRTRYQNNVLTPTQYSPRSGRSYPCNNCGPPERHRTWLRRHHCRRVCVFCASHGLSLFFLITAYQIPSGEACQQRHRYCIHASKRNVSQGSLHATCRTPAVCRPSNAHHA
jgi:hypothetical protein